MDYEWGRFVGWLGQNAAAVQALSALATVLLTAVLAGATIRYIILTARLAKQSGKQTEQSKQQLLLIAHPNIFVHTHVERQERTIRLEITNRGAYPFRLDNVLLHGRDDDGKDFIMQCRELYWAIVGSGDTAHELHFLRERNVELDSGAFEDWLEVTFECEDVLGLVKKHYTYCNVTGLREDDSEGVKQTV